jgi:methionine-rich copper-binding protein CopC
MKRTVRSAFGFAAALIAASIAIAACGELTGPESPSTPTGVVATLASATSATVTWTPSPLNDGVISYSIFRNGTKVGESATTSYTDTGLAQQTTYVYSVAANCKGGIVSDRSAETAQSTVTTVDITPPRVLSTIPVNGATGVSRAGTATVTFSEPMDQATINPSTFNIRITSSGQILAGTVTYNTTTRVAEFVPSAPLPNLTNVTVTVTAGAKDLAGNALSPVFIASWTTRDEDGPTVILSSPVNGAPGVAPGAAITVTFSESVQASTVNTTNISLKLTSSGATVAGTLNFNGTNIVTFTPSAPLAQGNYTLTVNNVKDLGGNSMPAPFVITFTVDTTPPTVTAVSPTAAQPVATTTAVQVTFSELMDVNTINTNTIQLRNSGTNALVPAVVTYNSTTNVATLTPSGPLSNATNYTVIVTTGVKDAAGNPLAVQFQSAFTTVALADTTAPTIVARSPGISAADIATNSNVTVTFSEAMNPVTINSTNITLRPTAGGADLTATVTCNSPCTTATLDPAADLLNNTSYTVTVKTGVKDLAGNQLAAQEVWAFTTINDAAPTVVPPTSPANGDTNVPVNTTVTVKFSEDMNASTVNTTTFNVKTTLGSIPVAGSVFYNTTTRVATFTPSANLAPNTSYTVTVTSGAKDLSGNGLALEAVFSFRTAP